LNKFFLLFQYLRYFFNARDEHSLHSPFAYTFYTELIKKNTAYPDFEKIESLRKKLKQDPSSISITDLGAGSGVNKATTRTVSSICHHSEKRPSLAQLIYRIVRWQQPKTILDLGTSLGLTTLYEAIAAPNSTVYTFEGCPNTAALAVKHFQQLNVPNIQLVEGNIDVTLPDILQKIPAADFVFFDANHRYAPTINYFNLCLEKVHEDSIFVFDDIYWSAEMKKAWTEIKAHPSVGMSMDLFFIGIVFFRKKQPEQHFILK